MLMMLCRQKVTKQSKMCGFSTTMIENSTLLYLRAIKIFLVETGTTRQQLQFQQSFFTMSHVITQRHGIDPKLR